MRDTYLQEMQENTTKINKYGCNEIQRSFSFLPHVDGLILLEAQNLISFCCLHQMLLFGVAFVGIRAGNSTIIKVQSS